MDRTLAAVQRQLAAMGSSSFEIGLFEANSTDQAKATMILRTYRPETLMQSIRLFRFENCRDCNVFIRPEGEHDLSMVDDLNAEAILRMKDAGFSPALVVETSPDNFQAWLKHPRKLQKELSTAAARSLALNFGGDMGAADWRHFGRLAGFTNRKSCRRGADGLFPFVKVREASGVIYQAAEEFIAQVELRLRKEKEQRANVRRSAPPKSSTRSRKSIDEFRANPVYGGDNTRIDLAYAIHALSCGKAAGEIEAVLATRDLSHKGGLKRQSDYLERTIKKAISLVASS